MLKIDILTLFPHLFDDFFKTSIIGRAVAKKFITPRVHDLKDWGLGQYKKVDDRPYSGGPGMIMRVDVTAAAIADLIKHKKPLSSRAKSKDLFGKLKTGLDSSTPLRFAQNDKIKTKVVLLTPCGKIFNQAMAKKLSKEKALLFICPHYEGYDERITSLADYKISIGNYVLTGGEMPTIVIIDAITRLLPGVIKKESLAEESFSHGKNLEYPQYTRPETFEFKTESRRIKKRVPKILLSGNHALIAKWRENKRK